MTTKSSTASALLADPAIAQFGDRYYIYPTTDGHADWGSTSFRVLSSDDLTRWEDHGDILRLGSDVAWADRHAWAPAIAERDGEYYFYFTADDQIGVAVSTSPTGPFVDSGAPIVRKGTHPGRAIDPSVFQDVDGAYWLIWGNGAANFARLNADMRTVDDHSIVTWTDPTFREAAHVHQRAGIYYLTWSENDAREPSYRVRWASGPSVTGPWSHEGVLVEQRPEIGIYATGHHSIARLSNDRWVIAYHRFARPGGDGFHREIVVDELLHEPGGRLRAVEPSERAIELISNHPRI